MTDLDHIESLVGQLEKGREYERVAEMQSWGTRSVQVPTEKADAALAEAYAVIERLAEELPIADVSVYRQRAEQAEAERNQARTDEAEALHRAVVAEDKLKTAESMMSTQLKQIQQAEADACQWADSFKLAEQSLVEAMDDRDNYRNLATSLNEQLTQAEADLAAITKRHDGEQKAKAKAERAHERWFKAATLAEAKQHQAEAELTNKSEYYAAALVERNRIENHLHDVLEKTEADLAAMTTERDEWQRKWYDMEDEYIQGQGDLAAAREGARKLLSRSCDDCVRPCDTVDESNYEGPEPYYCARYQPEEEK